MKTNLLHPILMASMLVFLSNIAGAQPQALQKGEKVDLAPHVTPTLCKAKATRKDGQIIVSVSAPGIRIKPIKDKKEKSWVNCWMELGPLVLGKQIRAYDHNGKKLAEEEVLQKLKHATAVACFRRQHETDPEKPDPFYAKAFRPDLVLLVFEAKYWLRQ